MKTLRETFPTLKDVSTPYKRLAFKIINLTCQFVCQNYIFDHENQVKTANMAIVQNN